MIRHSLSGIRTWPGLSALLIATSAAANGRPTLRMRAPVVLAQAPQSAAASDGAPASGSAPASDGAPATDGTPATDGAPASDPAAAGDPIAPEATPPTQGEVIVVTGSRI